MSGYYPLYVGAAYPASGGGGSGDMVLASVQTVTGAKTFNDSTLLLANVAGTFSSKFTNTNTAARTYTLPDAAGTIALTSDITGTNSGTNTGDQTITLTGAVTGSGTGSFVASLGSFTKSQLDTAVSDGNVMYVGDAPTAHNHDASAITTGTLGVARGGTGLSALGTSLQVLRTNAGATALEYATITAGDALTTNPLSQFAATTSAQLAGVISDETGSGALVFATSPTLVTPNIGAATGTSLAVTGVITTSANGAASTSALRVSGVPFAGTGTTAVPLVYINDANATASTILNTAGTYFGVNGDGTQDLMHLLTDGASRLKISSTGNVTVTNGATILNVAGTGTKIQDGIFSVFTDGLEIFRIRPNADWFRFSNFVNLCWASGGSANTGPDTQISRSSAGVLQIGTTSANALGSLLLTNLTASGAVTIGGGTAITKVLSATATLDFPSISGNDTHSLTMTVTGAIAGNAVFIGVPAALDANLIWQASVTAADTVTIRMHNASGASVDPASGTYRATVFQF